MQFKNIYEISYSYIIWLKESTDVGMLIHILVLKLHEQLKIQIMSHGNLCNCMKSTDSCQCIGIYLHQSVQISKPRESSKKFSLGWISNFQHFYATHLLMYGIYKRIFK